VSAGTAFHLSPLLGFMYEISPKVSLDANIRYNIVFSKDVKINDTGAAWAYNIGNIPINLGLFYTFGK
jgi:hypothetical protein